LKVTVEDGRVTALGGSKKNPFTAGFICDKIAHFDMRVHGPERILQPALRVGPKGSGQFRPCSWAEALAVIVDRFKAILAKEGGDAILPCSYGGSNGYLTENALDARLWHRMKATQLNRTLCAANTGAGTRAVYGDLPASSLDDMVHARLIICWGVNPSASGIHLIPLIKKVQKAGGKLIVVDPRKTPLAATADLHIAPLPGTDVALALALMGLAFSEGYADRAFLKTYAEDPEILEAATWTPAKAAALCEVAEADIRRFAEMYAQSSPAIVRCGWGVERTRNGSDAVRAILSLPAVYGKFGLRGGGYAMSTSSGYRANLAPLQSTALGAESQRVVNLSQLAEALETLKDPPIQAMYVYNCNPLATVPDQVRLERALMREDLFVVVHEQVWTDSCAYADVILPATTFLEHNELSNSYGSYLVQWSTPVIPPVGESRSNHTVFDALATALGYSEDELHITEAALAQAMTDQIPAVAGRWEELQRERVILMPRPVQFVDVFPSRPLSFSKDKHGNAIGAPQYRPPPADAELPLILISPATAKAISSTGYERLAAGEGRLGLHPEDAQQRGIADGDRVVARNHLGAVEVKVEIDANLRPGVACLPKGLWRSATENRWTSNALIPAHVDALGQGACYNDARVEVSRL